MSPARGNGFHITPPGVVPAVVKVVEVTLVGIGLALKRDVAVSISAHRQAHQPFHHIGHIKEHEQHLTLLGRVDALMVHQFIAQVNPWTHKQHAQQVDGSETVKRQYLGTDDLHSGKDTNFFAPSKILLPLIDEHTVQTTPSPCFQQKIVKKLIFSFILMGFIVGLSPKSTIFAV